MTPSQHDTRTRLHYLGAAAMLANAALANALMLGSLGPVEGGVDAELIAFLAVPVVLNTLPFLVGAAFARDNRRPMATLVAALASIPVMLAAVWAIASGLDEDALTIIAFFTFTPLVAAALTIVTTVVGRVRLRRHVIA
jgi:hypothetical protein